MREPVARILNARAEMSVYSLMAICLFSAVLGAVGSVAGVVALAVFARMAVV